MTPHPNYQQLLDQLRVAFPAPVSSPVHDGYVAFSILRALDQVDALKTQAPILGTPCEPDFARAAAQQVAENSRSLEEVMPELVTSLRGMPIWGHPRSQVNVVSHPSIASIIGVVLPSMYNPNLCSDESGRGFSEAEVRVASMTAELLGYDPQKSGGLFTFGGTGTMLYGVKVGLEKAVPGCMQNGLSEDVVILASEHSHYASLNVAGWLGIGHNKVIKIATHDDNSIDVAQFETRAREALDRGQKIAAIISTMGTTDAFGVDDLASLHEVRERLIAEYSLTYRPHIHADAVIGWAWSVFNQYDFQKNPLGFRGRTVRALAGSMTRIRHLKLADSVGIDFHKTGYTPYVSSLVLFRDRNDFASLVRKRETMPYLYHSGQYHPGMYTLETTRSACGIMSALANLLLLGREGLRVLLGHAVEMAELLREQIAARPELVTLNHENFGPVTLFRAYPDGVDTFQAQDREMHDPHWKAKVVAHNELNRKIYQAVHAEALAGAGVAIGFTDCYRYTDSGEPLNALKSYVLSPFAEASQMDSVIEHVLAARERIQASG